MTREDVDRWLERYVAAWKSNDPADIGDLFSADARYRYRPDEEPLVGREAIVQGWLGEGDEPGTFDASYSCWALDGDRAVATGTSSYTVPEQRVYDTSSCSFSATRGAARTSLSCTSGDPRPIERSR